MTWHAAGLIDAYPVNAPTRARVNGKLLVMFNVDGVLYATDPFCTHARAKLVEGRLIGTEVECPLHEGRFDVRTGKALCGPLTRDLRCYPVRVDRDHVHVDLPDALGSQEVTP